VVLPDVNVLVYAHRADAPTHQQCLVWLETVINDDAGFGLADLVLSGFLRVVTHPKVFTNPTPMPTALVFVEQLRGRPNCVPLNPGPRHWALFEQLCRTTELKGNLIPDAYLAAIAIEHGAEWITTDRDYARFPGLRWRHPLQP
jgi:uncharacterized protein